MKDPDFHDQLKKTGSKVFVVAAYGRILPKAILDIPDVTLNVHASLLPNWRGAAPIQRSLMAGDRVTGVSIMRLVEELDAGDVLLQDKVEIGPEMDGGTLEMALSECGAQALIRGLELLDRGEAKFIPQVASLATFAPPIEAGESRIQWTRTATEIHNHVRAFQPRPGTFTTDGRGRLKICRTLPCEEGSLEAPGTLKVDQHRLFVAAGEGRVEILEIQREGKKRQDARAFLSGYRIGPGQRWE